MDYTYFVGNKNTLSAHNIVRHVPEVRIIYVRVMIKVIIGPENVPSKDVTLCDGRCFEYVYHHSRELEQNEWRKGGERNCASLSSSSTGSL